MLFFYLNPCYSRAYTYCTHRAPAKRNAKIGIMSSNRVTQLQKNPNFRWMNELIIRQGQRDDLPDVLRLVHILAEFENAGDQVKADLAHYQEQFDDDLFEFVIAEIEHKIIGMALYYPTFSTWKGKMMYLEDFVVNPEYRSQGIGQLLFDRFIEESKKAKCRLVKWQVLNWNEGAIRFYERNNAKIQVDWHNCLIYF